MPGQRKKGKKRIAIWLTPEERAAIDLLVKSGKYSDMSDFVKRAINSKGNVK